MLSGKKSKKLIVVLNIMLLLIVLSACSFSKTKTANNTEWDIGNNVGEKWKDGQNYLMTAAMADSEKGYYYTITNAGGTLKNLYFFDKVSGKSAVVCDQPNCKHNSDTCPGTLAVTFNNLCYYNGYLFYTTKDENQTTHLYQMDSDAHNKKEIFTLCNINEGIAVDYLGFHRDNLFFYVVGRDGKSNLYRIDMKKNEKTLMYEKKEYGTLSGVKFDENYVYYKVSLTASDKTWNSTIYQYDINTGESKKIIDGEYCNSLTVTKDSVYYATQLNVKKYDLQTGTSSILLDDIKGAQLSNDGNYLYVDINKNSNKEPIPRKIIVYNWDNTIVDNIEVKDNLLNSPCFFGGPDYIFINYSKDNEMYYLNKSQIGTSEHTWIESKIIK